MDLTFFTRWCHKYFKMAAMKKDISDEDYWSSSTATKIKMKGFNMFDDSVDLEAAKKMVQQRGMFDDDEDDDGDVDTINWDGSSAGSIKIEYAKSARYRPTPPGTTKPDSGTAMVGLEGYNQPHTRSDSIRTTSPEASIDDIVSSAARRQPTVTEVAKLEAEINQLKRALEGSRKDKFAKIPPKETVKRIILGQPYSLEMYKGKEDKLQLLDEALRMHEGNAITAAVLFMRDTLKKSVFHYELRLRPVAVDHYISFLRQSGEWQEVIDLLGMLGRTDEAAMLKYRQAVSVRDAQTKIKSLKTCYITHFQTDAILNHEASLIQEQISLLERQLPVEEADDKAQKAGDLKFKESPRAMSLVGHSVMTTLYYCCLYHYNLQENCLASPAAIRKEHRLTDKQFVWVALQAFGRLRRWRDIEQLFQAKGWFGGTKMKPVIAFDRVVGSLARIGAPSDILNKYCSLIDDTDKRLEIANKHNCHTTIIETFKGLKDRQGLQDYYNSLKPQSQEWFYARDVLQASTIKWKN